MRDIAQARQGDVFFERIESLFDDAKRIEPDKDGRIVLALGEATGHAHEVFAPTSPKFSVDFFSMSINGIDTNVLRVNSKYAVIEHSGLPAGDHSPVLLLQGLYAAPIERTYTDEGEFPVMD